MKQNIVCPNLVAHNLFFRKDALLDILATGLVAILDPVKIQLSISKCPTCDMLAHWLVLTL